jgi:hypothetical protein
MPGAWVDPWSCTLVDKTPEMFWGHLVFDQAFVGICPTTRGMYPICNDDKINKVTLRMNGQVLPPSHPSQTLFTLACV